MQQSVSRIRTRLQNNTQYKTHFTNLCSALQQNIKSNNKKNINTLQSIISTKEQGSTKNNKQDKIIITKMIQEAVIKEADQKQKKQSIMLSLISKKPQLYKESFNKYFGQIVNRKISMLLWTMSFYSTLYVDAFKKVDKLLLKISEFQQQFKNKLKQSIKILRIGEISAQQELITKRLLQGYFRVTKANDQYLFNLCVLTVKIYSPLLLTISQIGGIFLSLSNLSNHFSSLPSQSHLSKLFQTLELIDQQSCEKVKKFTSKTSQNKKQFIKILKQFARSLGSCYLQYRVARFFLDNLLILGKNRMNIYIGFSILLMILFTQYQEQLQESQDNVIKLINRRSGEIKVDMFQRVFKVVYQGVNLNKLKNQQIQQEYEPKYDSFGDIISSSIILDPPIKTAICKLLEQEYQKKQKVPEFESLRQTKQSFKTNKQQYFNLAGIVPITVSSLKI